MVLFRNTVPAEGKFVTAACQPFAAQHTIPQHARMKQSWSAQLFQETVHVSSDQLLLLLGHRQQLLSTWAAAPGMAWLCLPGCTCWLWMLRFSGVTLTRSLIFFCCCCCCGFTSPHLLKDCEAHRILHTPHVACMAVIPLTCSSVQEHAEQSS